MGKSTGRFDKLVNLATNFVTQQQGTWDHASWQDFVSDTQKKGYELSVEMQDNLGVAIEAINQVYMASTSMKGVEKAVSELTTGSLNFVKQHQGIWGHTEWEDFIAGISQNSTNLSDETITYLGNLVEAIKTLYFVAPAEVIEKTAAKSGPKMVSKESEKRERALKGEKQQKKSTRQAGAYDDLTAIRGIGPAIEKKLIARGIQTYAQIAALTDKEIAKLEESVIKFSGRIKREDWVGQAKKLI